MADDLTDVDICNRALTKLGVSPIETLQEDKISTDIEAACARIYPMVRDSLLSMYRWPFALRKRTLSLVGDETPLNEWSFIFALPEGMVNGPSAVYGNGSHRPGFDYEIIDGKLYTNYTAVVVDFIRRPRESEMPPLFVQFFVTVLAMELAIPLTESSDRANELRIQAYGPATLDGNGGLFVAAKRAHSQNQPVRSLFQNGDPLTETRR